MAMHRASFAAELVIQWAAADGHAALITLDAGHNYADQIYIYR